MFLKIFTSLKVNIRSLNQQYGMQILKNFGKIDINQNLLHQYKKVKVKVFNQNMMKNVIDHILVIHVIPIILLVQNILNIGNKIVRNILVVIDIRVVIKEVKIEIREEIKTEIEVKIEIGIKIEINIEKVEEEVQGEVDQNKEIENIVKIENEEMINKSTIEIVITKGNIEEIKIKKEIKITKKKIKFELKAIEINTKIKKEEIKITKVNKIIKIMIKLSLKRV